MLTITRGGPYFRVADPRWENPLDGSYSEMHGGRWNPPNEYTVVYLNASVAVARANVRRSFQGLPYGPEDLEPDAAPVLIQTDVPTGGFLDVLTSRGTADAGLPATYPLDGDGKIVPHSVCQPIGSRAWSEGLPGVACRSAAPGAPPDGEELAWFQRTFPLMVTGGASFVEWYWGRSQV